MSKRDHQEDVVGPWAEEKLKVLESYLRYYCTRLSKKRLTLVYIDGFAGAAKVIRNTRKSPLYFLLWAGPHPAGLVGAKYILSDQPKLTASRRG